MAFIFGLICGALAVMAVRGILLAVVARAEQAPRLDRPTHSDWQDTRNFLYYDGTVMPTNEEEHNE